jgi:PAS domain S-box-containing protein
MPHRLLRYRLSWILIALALGVTCLAAWKARHETIILLQQTEETQDAVNGLLHSQNFGVAIANERGEIVYWNQALTDLTGFPAAEVRGKVIYDLIPIGDRDEQGVMLRDRHQTKYPQAIQRAKELDAQGIGPPTTIVSCHMPTKSGEGIKSRIAVRIVKGRHGNWYATAHIDPDSNIIRRSALSSLQPDA